MIESLIAYYCAPALAGIKPANIASCEKKCVSDIHAEINKLNEQLNCKGINFEIICECEKYTLIMVYRKKVLENHLQSYANRMFLSRFGYPKEGRTKDYIICLKRRLKNTDFPHEIGVFLGYPLHDIYSFINHRDDGCILKGEWKVYHNVQEAQKLFLRYKACRRALAKRVTGGRKLAQIF